MKVFVVDRRVVDVYTCTSKEDFSEFRFSYSSQVKMFITTGFPSQINPKRSQINPKRNEINPKRSQFNPKRNEINPSEIIRH